MSWKKRKKSIVINKGVPYPFSPDPSFGDKTLKSKPASKSFFLLDLNKLVQSENIKKSSYKYDTHFSPFLPNIVIF